MISVGELINASRKKIGEAITDQNDAYIKEIAQEQVKAGADYIDVNAGIFVDDEAEHLEWLVRNVQSVCDAPCCIDSPDPAAIEAAISIHKGTAMINSISLEKERYNALLPIVAGTDMKVVALCMSDDGMPETVDDRLKIADKLINGLLKNNVSMDNIYVDPLVQPISTNQSFGTGFLEAVEQILWRFEGVHTMCGLSNILFGLPNRPMLNQLFAVVGRKEIMDSVHPGGLGGTYGANPLACRAALAVLDVFEEENLLWIKRFNLVKNSTPVFNMEAGLAEIAK